MTKKRHLTDHYYILPEQVTSSVGGKLRTRLRSSVTTQLCVIGLVEQVVQALQAGGCMGLLFSLKPLLESPSFQFTKITQDEIAA